MKRNDDWDLEEVKKSLKTPISSELDINELTNTGIPIPKNIRPSSERSERPSSSGERVSRPSSSGERVSRSSSSGERVSRSSSSGERVSRSSSSGERVSRSSSSGERVPRPSSSGERVPRPSSSGERVPRPSSSGERVPRPSSSGERVPRPSSSGERVPRPSSSGERVSRPSSSGERVVRPENKEYLDNIQTTSISRNASKESSDDILAEIRYDLDKIDSNEDLHFKKEDEKFKVNMKDDLRKIPNYVPNRQGDSSGITVFAKVMFGIMIVAISVGISITIIFCGSNVLGLGTPNADYVIEIDFNYDLEKVSNTLENYGVIESSLLFKSYVKYILGIEEPDIPYGTYLLNSSMSYDEMLTELCQYSAESREVSVMFKEGITIYQMAKLLQENGVCNANEFIETIQDVDYGYDFLINDTDNKFLFHNKEGYMFPDTYMFYVSDDPVNVGKKMVQNYNNRVTALVEEALPTLNLTQHELMTIASIVQLEAPDLENMKKVASVYLNRINNPGEYSQLQADPTKEYANELKLQMEIIDQEIIDAYNTYAGIGLPPGPVCNPGLDAILAVLEPAETDYFYFCTNLYTGEFYFATNLEDHNKNVYNAGLRQ